MAEISWIDLRLCSIRQQDRQAEHVLLESIRTLGIQEPLQVAMPRPQQCILLDGFKRYRCARRLGIGMVPVLCVEEEERAGLLTLLRHSRQKGLSELEHGAVIDRLCTSHGMNISQIAAQLGCSVAWVSLRHGMIQSMSSVVRKAVLDGRFPPRSYLYVLRPFTRVKGVSSEMVDRFVSAVSGRNLSTREIFLLTRAYFDGSCAVQKRIEQGEIASVLEAIKPAGVVDGSPATLRLIGEIDNLTASMHRLQHALPTAQLHGDIALLRAHLAAAAVLRRIGVFKRNMRRFYDRTTEALGGNRAVEAGNNQQTRDRQEAVAVAQDCWKDYRSRGAEAALAQPIASTATT
jgi:hypothetical protein